MKSIEAIDHFGGISQTAKALIVSYEAVRKWGEYPPLGRQYQIQALTKGALKATTQKPEKETAHVCR